MRKSRHVWPSKISFSRVGYQWQILNISKDIDTFLFDPLPDIALHRYSKFLEGELFFFLQGGSTASGNDPAGGVNMDVRYSIYKHIIV